MLKKDLLKAAQPFCDVSFTIVSYKYGINCYRITGQLYVCQSLNFVKNVFSLLFSEAFFILLYRSFRVFVSHGRMLHT